MNRLLVLALLASYACASFASDAPDKPYIRIGDNQYMTRKDSDHVEGKLRDLDQDDDSGDSLCYSGDEDKVCGIIDAAIAEANAKKKDLKGKFAWERKKCKTKKDDSNWVGLGGYILFKVSRVVSRDEDGDVKEVISDTLPKCKRLDKIK